MDVDQPLWPEDTAQPPWDVHRGCAVKMMIIKEIQASLILLSMNHDFSAIIDVDTFGCRLAVESPSINCIPRLLEGI